MNTDETVDNHPATAEPSLAEVTEVTEVTEEVMTAFERLIPQLSSSKPPPSRQVLEAIATSEACRLLVARVDGRILGCLTLVLFPLPTGFRAWIEDVVVDDEARGRGVGAALNRHALTMADEAGAITVDLTSRPSREAANRLYKRLGFEARQTTVYRYKLRG